GNAGVGKSRLVAEVLARLAQREGVRILRGRCLAYGAGITYWPLMDVVREDAGITSSDDRGAVLAKLSARLATLFPAHLLPELLERSPSWAASRSNASVVHLEPLDERDTRSLLSGLLATADVPPPVASLITERSAGNPLFCEEFLRMLIDAGHLEFADGRWK